MDAITNLDHILRSFNIKATCVNFRGFASYHYYDIKLHSNARVSDIKRFADEIALALKIPCKPNLHVLHQEGIIRLEFAVPCNQSIDLLEYFTNWNIPTTGINCLLGQSVDGKRVWMDLTQNPHLLVAGTTGSGKSSLLHNIIANLFNYNDVELYLVDPKRIEFSEYSKIGRPIQVSYTYEETMEILQHQYQVMEERYRLIQEGEQVANLQPIITIIDEFADLIMQDTDEAFHHLVCRLAAKSRAARIHLILATQRPSVNFISGSIKANFPARIACRVATHVDSKVILDASGAESLLGKGDALLRDNTRQLERFQIAYATPQAVCEVFRG